MPVRAETQPLVSENVYTQALVSHHLRNLTKSAMRSDPIAAIKLNDKFGRQIDLVEDDPRVSGIEAQNSPVRTQKKNKKALNRLANVGRGIAAAAALSLPFQPMTAAFADEPTPEVPQMSYREMFKQHPENKIMAAYVPCYSLYRDYDFSRIKRYDMVFSFTVTPKPDGGLMPINQEECKMPDKKVIDEAHAANSPALLVLGGDDPKQAEGFDGLAQNEQARKNFIKNVAALVRDGSFDGIDIDWEFAHSENDAKLWLNLVKEFRAVLGEDAIITVAVPSSAFFGNSVPIEEMLPFIDFVSALTYNMNGYLWSETASPNAPTDIPYSPEDETKGPNYALSVVKSLRYWHETRGVPLHMLLFGQPAFGIYYLGTSKMGESLANKDGVTMQFRDIVTMIRQNQNIRVKRDSRDEPPYINDLPFEEVVKVLPEKERKKILDYVSPQDLKKLGTLSFDDTQSGNAKCVKTVLEDSIGEGGIRGAFSWEDSQDDQGLAAIMLGLEHCIRYESPRPNSVLPPKESNHYQKMFGQKNFIHTRRKNSNQQFASDIIHINGTKDPRVFKEKQNFSSGSHAA